MGGKTKKAGGQTRVYLLLVAVLAVVLVGLGARFLVLGPEGGESGVPTIGGPFELVRGDTGETVTDQTFRDKVMVIYFGYTFCPDVCPTNLSSIANALDLLPPETLAHIVPIFITVDPDRDTAAVVGDYARTFHPKMIGLTGTADQVAAAAKAYKVYYKKVEEEGGNPDYYLMDHSAVTYVMGPDGAFIRHFPHAADPAMMAQSLADIVKARF